MPLRVPASLHRALKEAADREGVSLNQYCLYLLSLHSGKPLSPAGGQGEELLKFLEEANLLQGEMRPARREGPSPSEPAETPLTRWRRLYAKN